MDPVAPFLDCTVDPIGTDKLDRVRSSAKLVSPLDEDDVGEIVLLRERAGHTDTGYPASEDDDFCRAAWGGSIPSCQRRDSGQQGEQGVNKSICPHSFRQRVRVTRMRGKLNSVGVDKAVCIVPATY